MSATCLFLDVEEADRATVRTAFPAAQFAPGDLDADALVEACRDATMISPFVGSSFPRAVLERLPEVRLIAARSVGTDHIDLAACRERGITVCNVPDYGSHVIAEHAFALLLSSLRHIHVGNERVKRGVFDYHGLRGMALKDKTIGIVGTGKIGRAAAHIAHGFGMRILATDAFPAPGIEAALGLRYVPLQTLLAESDIISLHVPSSPDTRHLLNATTLGQTKPGVVIVNTARGAVIDSTALLAALNDGHVGWALLDVLEHEGEVHTDAALVAHPRVVATPHIAFYADDSMQRMYAVTLENMRQWEAGSPQNVVA